MYAQVAPALVELTSNQQCGTGFFIDAGGHIATAAHVVLGAANLNATTNDGTSYKARIIKLDDTADLAELELVGFDHKDQKFLSLDKSAALTAHEKIYAFGFPHCYQAPYVSPGEVDSMLQVFDVVNKDATAVKFNHSSPGERLDLLEALHRTLLAGTIHAENGESGGPAINSKGVVIGITDIVNDQIPQAHFTPVAELNNLLAASGGKFSFDYGCSESDDSSACLAAQPIINRSDGDKRSPFDWKTVLFR